MEETVYAYTNFIRADAVFEPSEEEMNGHMHRGLPPTPTHSSHMESSRPPPCPREMYSQGMYASIDDPVEHRRVAPPPPKRNPETRLSTASVSSTGSQGNYEELHVEESVQYQQHHHQGYHHDNMARHTTHGSPVMSSKFSHEPQSPSHAGNRPFSYGAPMMHSPKHKVAPSNGNQHNQNGHSNHPQVLHNYQYTENHSASPATAYGKHESVFHPQPHRPPPQGPPPPPPAGGHGQRGSPSPHPQSPKLQRHSITTIEGNQQRQPMRSPGSPKMIPRLSQRSQSVPTSTLIEHGYMPESTPTGPVSLGGNYMAGYLGDRTPSPPLPPPPPELLESWSEHSPSPPPQTVANMSNVPPQTKQSNYNPSLPNQSVSQQQSSRSQQQRSEGNAPPPPPPLSSIPTKHSVSPDRNINIQKSAVSPTNGKVGVVKGSNSSTPKSREGSPAATDELMQKLNRRQQRNADPQEIMPHPENHQHAGNPVPSPFGGVKLRPTAARLKLIGQQELSGESETSSKEESPAPEIPVETPSPVETKPARPLSPSEDMFEKRLEIIQNKIKVQDDTSNNSKMSITVDDIDLDDVPGYTPVTKATPIWKRDMIEKKNQEKIEEYIAKKRKEAEEEEKWKNVPVWKQRLLREKEKEKETKSVEELQKAADEEANRKRRIKEAEEEKKARIKEDQERQKEMEKELEDVPAWKREIMMKRGGAIKNWGDERENINDQEGEEEDQGYESNCQADTSTQGGNSDSSRTFVQKATLAMKPQNSDIPSEKPRSKAAPPPAPKRVSLDDARLEDEWESLPLWKREIMMKRGGAPTNWGDEREEVDE